MSGQITDQESLKYLVGLGQATPKVIPIHDDGDMESKLIVKANGESIIMDFNKPPVSRKHEFSTIKGFMDYINSPHCKDQTGIIFVSPDHIEARFNYLNHGLQMAFLRMTHAEEFKALLKILFDSNGLNGNGSKDGLYQKELWRLLISDLDGCIDKSLALMLMQVNIKENEEYTLSIDATGLQSGTVGASVKISVRDEKRGEQSATIQTDWQWRGRIWECFDGILDPGIDLRMEIMQFKGSPPRFTFHAKRLQSAIDDELQNIVDVIRAQAPENFTVYEGAY